MSTERDFARGMRILRHDAVMSQRMLAKAMTQRGVPTGDLAVLRIEREENGRRIRLDEAVAVAAIFGRSVERICQLGCDGETEAVEAAPPEDQPKLIAAELRRLATLVAAMQGGAS